MTPSASKRILAVDPGMQYLGVALLEGENLMWYAVKTFPDATTCHQMRTQVHEYLSGIIRRYQPTILAVEEPFYAQSLLSGNLCKLTEDLKTWGKWKGLKVHSYYPPAVKAYFCRDQKTKQSLAEAMIERYPHLVRSLSPLPWRRRYWFHVFDAIGLGLMCQQKLTHAPIARS
jgi:Holliday junction resolvasome RuvABC endonuclease subunit